MTAQPAEPPPTRGWRVLDPATPEGQRASHQAAVIAAAVITRLRREGIPVPGDNDGSPIQDRIRLGSKQEPGGCWTWSGKPDRHGYGRIRINGDATRLAHRISYEAFIGPIPDRLVIDHLCRNRMCVNPEHMEPVTNGENLRRGLSAQKARERGAAQTHCKRGHEFTADNTYRVPSTGHRRCITCREMAGHHAKPVPGDPNP